MAVRQQPELEAVADEGPVPALENRRRRWPWLVLVLVVIAAVSVAAPGWFQPAEPAEPTEAESTTLVFSDVVRTTLEETSTYDGTLGRVTGDPVIVRTDGTITGVPQAGDVLQSGDVLLWVDGEPVVVLEGDVPAWRNMRDGTEGVDVLQLESALDALGFNETADVTVDEEYTSFTETMVAEWQEAAGAEVDERVDFGEVVFLPEAIRIDEVLVSVGSPVRDGEAVVTTSADDIYVTFGLPTTEQGVLRAGDAVEVEMPDGTDTQATVVEIDTVATRAEQGNQATFEVTLVLDDPSVAEGIEEAPVEVTVITESVADVVAVPVTSLVALVEGGYAVEVDAGNGQTRLVAVEPGFYADGLVEVVEGDLGVGDRVVAP